MNRHEVTSQDPTIGVPELARGAGKGVSGVLRGRGRRRIFQEQH